MAFFTTAGTKAIVDAHVIVSPEENGRKNFLGKEGVRRYREKGTMSRSSDDMSEYMPENVMATVDEMEPRGGQHLGPPVADIETAKVWYTEQLGFEVIHEPRISTDAGEIEITFLKQGNMPLECYQLFGKEREEILT